MNKPIIKIENNQDLYVQTEMLRGNINRMCISNDQKEVDTQYIFAQARIEAIYKYNSTKTLPML